MDPRSADPGPLRGPGPWTVLDYPCELPPISEDEFNQRSKQI